MPANNTQFNMTIKVNDKEVTHTLNSVGKDLRRLRANTRNLEEGTEDWYKANKELAKTEKIYDDMKVNQRDLLKEMKKGVDETEQYQKSIEGVGKKVDQLKKSIDTLDPASEKYKKSVKEYKELLPLYERMQDEQKELLNLTKETTEASEDNNSAISEFGDSVSEAFEALASGDLIGFQAAWAGVTAGIRGATRAAWAFIATPIGAAIAVLATLGTSVYFLANYNKELHKLNEELRALGVDTNLAAVRSGIQATAETFDKEFSDIAKKAKSLATTYGISMTKANDIIAQGLADGGKKNDEFLDSLGEYDIFFKDAGYSAQQFVDIINQGYELGIYSDKLPDAIKEAGISLKEQTTATRDALVNAFGAAFADEILSKIDKGQITVSEGLEAIAEQAKKTGLTQQQQAQLTADIFRGAGEDAGGAMKILEAISQSAQRELSATAQAEWELVEANKRLNEAQAKLFGIEGFGELWITIKSKTIGAIADIMQSLAHLFNGIEQAKNQGAQEGKLSALEDVSKNTNKFHSAEDEAVLRIEKARKTVGRLQKVVDDLWIPGALFNESHHKNLSEAKAYLEELKNIAKGKTAELNKYVDNLKNGGTETAHDKITDNNNDPAGNTKTQALADAKAAKIKASEKLVTEFLNQQFRERELSQMTANEKEVSLIDEKYATMIEKAGENAALVKELEISKQQEKDEALAAKQEEELVRIAEFEARKQELLDELELQKAETKEEEEEIKKEQALEKEEAAYEKKVEDFEAEMEWLKLTEVEKNEVLEALKEQHEQKITNIEKKHAKNRQKAAEEIQQQKIELRERTLNASIHLAGRESKIGQALLAVKRIIALKEFAIEQGLFKSKSAIKQAEVAGDIASGKSATAAVGAPWNILPLILFAAQVSGIMSTMVGAANAGNAVSPPGFARGGYTDLFGTGRRDKTGHEVAGVVHTGEYVVPAIVRRDPEVPQILNYLETKRKKKLGLYANGGDTSETSTSSSSHQGFNFEILEAMLVKLMLKLDTPFQQEILFGAEAEIKRQEQEKKIKKIQNASQVKKR